jgi:hypothetical protein
MTIPLIYVEESHDVAGTCGRALRFKYDPDRLDIPIGGPFY